MTSLRRNTFKIFVVVVILLDWQTTVGQSAASFVETRRLLSEMGSNRLESENLATLFRVGDERINDLIKALDDSDEDIRLNAQIVIRYLGNDKGMDALLVKYEKAAPRSFTFAGPAPLPIHELDYKFIDSICSERLPNPCNLPPSYIFALARDGSAKAISLLRKVIEHEKTRGNENVVLRYAEAKQSNQVFGEKGNLQGVILNNAFFLSARERRLSNARLIAYNGMKDKALLEIHVDAGPLAEGWYHVVVSRHGQGWKIFSISLVSVS